MGIISCSVDALDKEKSVLKPPPKFERVWHQGGRVQSDRKRRGRRCGRSEPRNVFGGRLDRAVEGRDRSRGRSRSSSCGESRGEGGPGAPCAQEERLDDVDCWKNGGPSRPCLDPGRTAGGGDPGRGGEEPRRGRSAANRARLGEAGWETDSAVRAPRGAAQSRRRTEQGLDPDLVGVGIGKFERLLRKQQHQQTLEQVNFSALDTNSRRKFAGRLKTQVYIDLTCKLDAPTLSGLNEASMRRQTINKRNESGLMKCGFLLHIV
ncbi:hypothetical protein WMY93_030294 [Mugilogobius chulae]|uniref:Uncharacterized protein n=1 Tax=Mugilogobius chulae TaxID=88201 RepID=A0AAW0MQW7_9GOBI